MSAPAPPVSAPTEKIMGGGSKGEEKAKEGEDPEEQVKRVRETIANPKKHDFTSLYNRLQIRGSLVIFDCRSSTEWQEAHLISALPCPFGKTDLEEKSDLREIIKKAFPEDCLLPLGVSRNQREYSLRLKEAERLEHRLKWARKSAILYGEPERIDATIKALVEDPMNKMLHDTWTVSDEVLQELREKAGFCFEKYDPNVVPKPMIKVRTHPNVILPKLFLGAANQATNREVVSNLGVSHILNITKGCPCQFKEDEEMKIEYLQIHIHDQADEDIQTHFEQAVNFIKKGMAAKGILVHCMCGVSRSVSCVLAFLIQEKKMSLGGAYKFVKERRTVACPNLGFVDQLGKFEEKLTGKNTKKEVFNIDWKNFDPKKSGFSRPKDPRELFGKNKKGCTIL